MITRLPPIEIIIAWLIEELLKALKGSIIFIYGPEGSGKTALAKFLVEGEIYEKYIPTRMKEVYEPKGKKIKLSEFDFRVERIITGPGSVYPDSDLTSKEISFKILKESAYDYLFYVYDVSKIFNNDTEYIQCIEADVELMEKYVTGKNILIIGTHLDRLNIKNIEKDRKTIEEQISNTQIITKMIIKLQKNNNKIKGPIIGSLKNQALAEELTLRILKAMYELKKVKKILMKILMKILIRRY